MNDELRTNKGFTLIELLVAVGILGLMLPVLPGVVFLLAGLYVLIKLMKKTSSSVKKGPVQ